MKKVSVLLCISLILSFGCTEHCQQKYTKLVDPFIGTGGTGHTFPGATLPSGMVQLSPDTGIKGWNWCSGYHESDSSLMGFSHTHLSGTGGADYGDISAHVYIWLVQGLYLLQETGKAMFTRDIIPCG